MFLRTQPACRRQVEPYVQFLEPLGRDRRRCLHQQVLSLLVHREGDDLAQIGLVGDQLHDAVDAGRRAAVGGAPNLNAFNIPPNRPSTSARE